MSFKFKKGDRVQIFDIGHFYSTYQSAYEKCNMPYKSGTHKCTTGAVGYITGIAKHAGSNVAPEDAGKPLYGLRLDNGETCVVGENGIQYEGTMLPKEQVKAEYSKIYYLEWRNVNNTSYKTLKWFLRPEQASNILKVSNHTDAIFMSSKKPKFMDEKDADECALFNSDNWLVRPATPNEHEWANGCMNKGLLMPPPADMLWDRRQKEVKKEENIIDNYDLI